MLRNGTHFCFICSIEITIAYSQPLNFVSFSAELGKLVNSLVFDDCGVHIEADTVSGTEQLLDGLLRRHDADGHQRQGLQGRVLDVGLQTVDKRECQATGNLS